MYMYIPYVLVQHQYYIRTEIDSNLDTSKINIFSKFELLSRDIPRSPLQSCRTAWWHPRLAAADQTAHLPPHSWLTWAAEEQSGCCAWSHDTCRQPNRIHIHLHSSAFAAIKLYKHNSFIIFWVVFEQQYVVAPNSVYGSSCQIFLSFLPGPVAIWLDEGHMRGHTFRWYPIITCVCNHMYKT